MPRVANPPRAQQMAGLTPRNQQSPIKIPLNDDRQEKAVRLQSRHALHELQMNSLIAAASPVKKLNNYQRAASDSPKTPRSRAIQDKENAESRAVAITAASAMTPVKRVPILANFEEWMKMATDNKINATNSWNFALIDYFHDMSLLKEGDGVNFQKASCTLDGCVKIYTSRVDSVATETGKLLSGLAESGNKKSRKDSAEEDGGEGDDEEAEEGDDGVKKRPKRKIQRSSEATLAPSFTALQLKKLEIEFAVDPLFKKASADFDEGGAKGLLLNHLAIDSQGRIVFDSSDDTNDATADPENLARCEISKGKEASEECLKSGQEVTAPGKRQEAEIDLEYLSSKFFPDIARLDEQDICPSLKGFDLGNPAGSLDIPLLKSQDDTHQNNDDPPVHSQSMGFGEQTGIYLEDNAPGFDDNDDAVLARFDIGGEAAFGDGGEVWAKNAAVHAGLQMPDGISEGQEMEDVPFGRDNGPSGFDPTDSGYAVSLRQRHSANDHDDIMSYFDNALRKNWAGPEHWRIRKIKDNVKPSGPTTKRKEKEPFEIDFFSPLDLIQAEVIYTPAASNSAISLPKAQWISKTRNLLPDDKHFNSRQLLSLFIKPKARMGSRKANVRSRRSHVGTTQEAIPEGEIDEAFWARKENGAPYAAIDDSGQPGNYDANFFQDDGLDVLGGPPDDDDEFADAREVLSPDIEGNAATDMNGILGNAEANQEGAFGSQLVTQSRRLRPEYVQYARVAKKVDVRRLKEEMWRGIGFEKASVSQVPASSKLPAQPDSETLKFTSIMNNLQQVYPSSAMADISTSYCFICLLHLANEKGLSLANEPGFEELSIRKDMTAEITEGSE